MQAASAVKCSLARVFNTIWSQRCQLSVYAKHVVKNAVKCAR